MKAYRFGTRGGTVALALAAFFAYPLQSAAQLTRVGVSNEIVQASTRGVDGSYDPRSDTYLMVGGNNAIYGVCVGADGKPKAAPFTIKPLGTAGRDRNEPFGAFPRARYSPDIDNGNGGFLVVWTVEAGSTGWGPLHTRIVSCTSGLLGVEQIIDPLTSFIESGAAIAYSETSKRFLVVWNNNRVIAKTVDNSGAGVGTAVSLSAGFGRDPGVVWNPVTNEFGVSFSGETYSAFVRVPAAAPAAFARNTFNPIGGKTMTTITDVDFNTVTNTYLMAWFESGFTRVAEFDAAGKLLGQRLVSTTLGSYDALSLSFNPRSGTYLLVGVDHPLNNANTDAVIATELDGHGVPIQADFRVSTSTPPARYPRVVASTQSKGWNASWSGRNFSALTDHVVQTATVGPGTNPAPAPAPAPSPSPAPSPTPVTSLPRMNVDTPTAGARVSSRGFTVAGWAIDAAASATSGVDAVDVWAYPLGGSTAVFVGTAAYGSERPDISAAFSRASFGNSGFLLNATLAPGTYDLAVFPHSTVAGSFNNRQLVRITVEESAPHMWVDTPSQNQTMSRNIKIGGWALDLAATADSGVDAVHVWAYPTDGSAPVFVGAGSLGVSRPDVGATFGAARYNNAGFNVEGTLPPGTYTIVVFAHSSIANAFNNVVVITVRVV